MVLFGYSWARAGAPRMDVMTTRLDARVAAVARNEFFRFSIMDLPSRCWLGIGGGELIRRTIRPSSYVLEVGAGCGFAWSPVVGVTMTSSGSSGRPLTATSADIVKLPGSL